MPQLYARVFLQVLDSSLAENWVTRHVFEDLLKLANEDGVVDMTAESIARRTNIPLKIIRESITQLESRDTASRDSDCDGRRIERLDDHRDWGWRIVNWHKYDRIRVQNDMREFNAMRMRNYRSKKPSETPPLAPPKASTNTTPTPESRATCRLQESNLPLFTTIQYLLNDAFSRPYSQKWTYDEEWSLSQLMSRSELQTECSLLVAYKQKSPKYFPRSISKLLQTWNDVLDRARNGSESDHRAELSANTQAILDKSQLERVEKQISAILNSYDAHQSLSESDREKLKPLRSRRAELIKKLGFQA